MRTPTLAATLSLPLVLAGLACSSATPTEPVSGPLVTQVAASGTLGTFDANRIAYEMHGSGDPAVVLVHCWSCDRTFWREQIAPLAARYTVVALDLPGHGASTAVARQWDLAGYGRDVAAAVQSLGLDEVVLVGHSMGGAVAVEAARLLPDRVLGIVAVDTLHDAEFRWPADQFAALMAAYEADFAGTCRQFVGTMFIAESDPELRERVTAEMCDADPAIATALLAGFDVWDAPAALAAAGVPIRAVNAAAFPTAVETNRKYADFDAVVLEGVGHFLQLEDPARVNAAIVAAIDQLAAR